jgi:putative redox protein
MTDSNKRQVRLRWDGEGHVFRGGPDGGPQVTVDGDKKLGLAPMQMLLMSMAACMAIDVVMILQKGRVPVESMEINAVGERVDTAPKRFRSVELVYRTVGVAESDRDKLERAIELSRDKYCSVLHTLDAGLDLDIRVELA